MTCFIENMLSVPEHPRRKLLCSSAAASLFFLKRFFDSTFSQKITRSLLCNYWFLTCLPFYVWNWGSSFPISSVILQQIRIFWIFALTIKSQGVVLAVLWTYHPYTLLCCFLSFSAHFLFSFQLCLQRVFVLVLLRKMVVYRYMFIFSCNSSEYYFTPFPITFTLSLVFCRRFFNFNRSSLAFEFPLSYFSTALHLFWQKGQKRRKTWNISH